MLSIEAAREDLEKTAQDIISRKFWCIRDVALFLDYSWNHTNRIIERKGYISVCRRGMKHIYAIDALELFEEKCGMQFPELKEKWYKDFEITPSPKTLPE